MLRDHISTIIKGKNKVTSLVFVTNVIDCPKSIHFSKVLPVTYERCNVLIFNLMGVINLKTSLHKP